MAGCLRGLDTMPAAAEQQQKERTLSAVAAADAERRRGENKCTIVAFVCAFFGSLVLFVLCFLPTEPRDQRYTVAIDAVSGLTSSRMDLALNPEFNLTLRVTSLNRHHKACVEPGTYLEVAYRCVTLATSATAQHPLCAGPREMKEQRLVATGTRVRVPGAVLDSLAADMRNGELVFQVAIRRSGDKYAGDMLVASCGGRQVGAADHDLHGD